MRHFWPAYPTSYINGQWVAGTGEPITLEMGKPIAEANGEISYRGEFLRWFSEEAVRISGRYGTNPVAFGLTAPARSTRRRC